MTVSNDTDAIPISHSSSFDAEAEFRSSLRDSIAQFPSEFVITAINGYRYDDALYSNSSGFSGVDRNDIILTAQSKDICSETSSEDPKGEWDFTWLLILILLGIVLLVLPKGEKSDM